MQLAQAIEAFLLSYRGSKSQQTVVWYERRMAGLLAFMGFGIEPVTWLDRWRCDPRPGLLGLVGDAAGFVRRGAIVDVSASDFDIEAQARIVAR